MHLPWSEWNYEESCCLVPIIVIRVSELLFIAVGIPLFALFVRIIYRKKVFHSNLRLLFCFISMNDIAVSFVRLYEIGDFSSKPVIAPTIAVKRLWHLSADIAFLTLAIERVVAVFFYESYERLKWPLLTIVAILLDLLACIVVTLLRITGYITANQLAGVCILIAIIALLISLILPILTRIVYAKSILERFAHDEHSMTRRYTTIENIRTLHVLKFFVPFFSIILISDNMMIYSAYVYLFPTHLRFLSLFHALVFSTGALRMVGCMVIILYAHETLRRYIYEVCGISWPENNVITNVKGVQLQFPVSNEPEIYFSGYVRDWGRQAELSRIEEQSGL